MDLRTADPEIYSAIRDELARQQNNLQLIASENYASEEVLAAMGSVMTNKYAEGYPGRRYYGGCEFVDVAENLAIERCKKLFECDHVNVQPHSGSQANMEVYFAVLKPDRALALPGLDAGLLIEAEVAQVGDVRVDPAVLEPVFLADGDQLAGVRAALGIELGRVEGLQQ